jgi:hypothetical protein
MPGADFFVRKRKRSWIALHLSYPLTAILAAALCPFQPEAGEISEKSMPDSTITERDPLNASIGDIFRDSLAAPDGAKHFEYNNIHDTAGKYFLNPRLSLTGATIRSQPRDAADLAHVNPSNFIVEYQSTPFRKILSPFALPGNRMNVIFNGRSLHPVEHLIEPDNKMDFNDIPTAPVADIYNLEGPLGMVLGAENGTSSLIMQPYSTDTTGPKSKLVVDKGSFGYAYTKAVFANDYPDGKSIRLALGYRKAAGAFVYRDDDGYHQWGEVVYPVKDRLRLNFSGRLYRRKGTYIVRPIVSSYYLNRFRRDRDLSAGLEYAHSPNHTSRIEFRHQRSESKIDRWLAAYWRGLDIFDNSIILSHDMRAGQGCLNTSLSATQEKFNDGSYSNKRHRGYFDFRYLRKIKSSTVMTYFKLEKVGGFDPAPSGALIFSKSGESYYLENSIGYCVKMPRQYELDLSPRYGGILSITGPDYYESGNRDLKPEKQLTGHMALGIGKPGSDMLISITGGKIFDGIDWRRSDTSSLGLGAFVTGNNEIEFANITARQKISFWDKLYWSGGGSYRYAKIGEVENLPYSPDYQLFSNLELYHYVEKLELHLYGYGEAIYYQPYEGYLGEKLGKKVIMNANLSFRIKKFRFYYAWQNIPAYVYLMHEDYSIPGRYISYGIIWEFLD